MPRLTPPPFPLNRVSPEGELTPRPAAKETLVRLRTDGVRWRPAPIGLWGEYWTLDEARAWQEFHAAARGYRTVKFAVQTSAR